MNHVQRGQRDTPRAALHEAVLDWAAGAGRDLPWRHTRDPWAILVSEVMLQQTQVARVVPAYTAFLIRFPTVSACAAAPVSAVVRAWDGLGYNRRAVNLHRAASATVERHRGRLPLDLDALLALPGVGAYTARAVLAFSAGADVAIVDTNTARVLARAVAGRRLTRAEAQSTGDALVPPGEGWAWNTALLDLGATVCTSRNPRCEPCPIGHLCRWHTAGRPEPDPSRGSAGTSTPQSTFEGSDRQGRGRLVKALRQGPLPWSEVATVAGWPHDRERADRAARQLIADGLAEDRGADLALPDLARSRHSVRARSRSVGQ